MSDSLSGRTVLGGEYELRDVLGRGGMAMVYRARSRSLDTDVAVKVLSPRLAADAGFRGRFHDEARSLAGLHHPNLVEVHHYDEEDDLVYIVMRLVGGGTLKDRLRARGRPLDAISTARLISQVADALQLAHERGLVHLDIKPANILLGRADWPLLADFGITSAVGTEKRDAGPDRIAGTPLYMSPEQARGGDIDGRSDEYSLAITAFEMLTGRCPFDGQTTESLLAQHRDVPPPRPRDVNPGIPRPVEEVLLRALAKDPNDRYPTIREFAGALAAAAESARGMSLAAKDAAAGLAPSALGALGLILIAPALLAILPTGALLAGRIPLAWPFQLLIAALVGLLLLSARWHLLGLAGRAVGSLFAAKSSVGGRQRATPSGAASALEGTLDLAYVLLFFGLLGKPALVVTAAVAGAEAGRIATLAALALAGVAALAIIAREARSGGPAVAALLLALAGTGLIAAAAGLVIGDGSASTGWISRAVAGLVVLALLVAIRSNVVRSVEQGLVAVRSALTADVGVAANDGERARSERESRALAGGAVNLAYLVVAGVALGPPLVGGLTSAVGSTASAMLAIGVTAVLWLFLGARLWLAGRATGLIAALVIGSPLLLGLPAVAERLSPAGWPTLAAAWAVGGALALLVALLRSPVRTLSERALGPRLEGVFLGATAAKGEEESVTRRDAFFGLAGALVDVVLLVGAYWALGVPATESLGRTTGSTFVGSVAVGALLVVALAIVVGPARRVGTVVSEGGGNRRAARALGVGVALVAALIVAGGAAAPLAFASPGAAGGLWPAEPLAPTVIVDLEHWQPATPDAGSATYSLSLSCSDGRPLGQFREASGTVTGSERNVGFGALGRPAVPCDAWRDLYYERRRAAGLDSKPSLSWDWLDVRAKVNADESVDLVETHRLSLTSGARSQLVWRLSDGAARPTGVDLLDDRLIVPLSAGRGTLAPAEGRVWDEGGSSVVGFGFDEIVGPAKRDFAIRYRLLNATVKGGGIEIPIVSSGRGGPVWRTTIAVELPAALAGRSLRLTTRGAPARSGLTADGVAWFEAVDIPDAADLTVSIEAPLDAAPTPTATPTAAPTAVPTGTVGIVTLASPTPTTEASATPSPSSTTETATATSEPTATAPAAVPTPTPTSQIGTPTIASTATATSTAIPPPDIQSFTSSVPALCSSANAAGTGTVTLTWNVANATSVRIEPNVGDGLPASGSRPVTLSQSTTYRLSATGLGGTAVREITVYVDAPLSISLSAQPVEIVSGSGSTLAWTVPSTAASADIQPGIGPVSGSSRTTIRPTTTTTYTLTARTTHGCLVTRQAAVLIVTPTPIPLATIRPILILTPRVIVLTPVP